MSHVALYVGQRVPVLSSTFAVRVLHVFLSTLDCQSVTYNHVVPVGCGSVTLYCPRLSLLRLCFPRLSLLRLRLFPTFVSVTFVLLSPRLSIVVVHVSSIHVFNVHICQCVDLFVIQVCQGDICIVLAWHFCRPRLSVQHLLLYSFVNCFCPRFEYPRF